MCIEWLHILTSLQQPQPLLYAFALQKFLWLYSIWGNPCMGALHILIVQCEARKSLWLEVMTLSTAAIVILCVGIAFAVIVVCAILLILLYCYLFRWVSYLLDNIATLPICHFNVSKYRAHINSFIVPKHVYIAIQL